METTVRWYERMRALPLPDLLKLAWEKQRDSVDCSRKLILPSAQMREVMARCYPATPEDKFWVMPWGVAASLAVPADARVLLTLSPISPEKGQDLLLQALF